MNAPVSPPPADDQAELAAAAYARTAEADPELTGYYERSPHSLRSIGWALHGAGWATPDGAGWATPDEVRALRGEVNAARAASLQITEWRAAERRRNAVLSGLLRGMARRVGNLRKNGRHFVGITDKLQDRLDSACIERDDLQAELADLDRLRRNHDALSDAYVATREALDHTRARLTAVRALADKWTQELLRWRGTPQNFAKSTAEHLLGTHAADVRAVLDGPTEAPTMRYELGCVVCATSPYFRLEPFESNDARQAWADAHQAATGHEEFRYRNTPVSDAPPVREHTPPCPCGETDTHRRADGLIICANGHAQ